MKKKICFIVNPKSGLSHKRRLPGLIRNHLDHRLFEYDIFYTEARGHAVELSRQACARGYDIVCISGGDGSVNEAARALIHRETALAILPSGSGNGIARHLGIPLRINRAIELINHQPAVPIDTLKINDLPVIGVAGFGFDARIAERFDHNPIRGLIGYSRIVLQEIKKYKSIRVFIEEEEYARQFFCTIANTSQFGNKFHVSPESGVRDGRFEIVLAESASFFKLLKLGWSSRTGTMHRNKNVKIISTDTACLRPDGPKGHIDGEPVYFEARELMIRCLPRSLKVICGRDPEEI